MVKQIVIAGTLKPVDDVRAFEKIAQTIAKTNKYEINIIGNSGKKESRISNIHFRSHKINRNEILKRHFLGIGILLKTLKIKPVVIIITSHELLLVAVLLKLITGSKIIYDVQEDYLKNLWFISDRPRVIRLILGQLIRWKEKMAKPFVDQFWLAEKCYQEDLKFTRNRSLVIENKAKAYPILNTETKGLKIIFTGTVSHYSEVLLAIDIFQKIKQRKPETTFQILGQCHDPKLRLVLEELAKTDASVILNISQDPVDHEKILRAISTARLGIISYQENAANRKKIPTKLYEYSRYQLPYLIHSGTYWEQKAKDLGGAIAIDFNNPDTDFILDQLKNPFLLFTKSYPEKETWESQEPLINGSIDYLVH